MKYILLRPEQLIFDSEEAAINYYKNPKPQTPEERWANQRLGQSDEQLEKVLVCSIECLQVITPTIAVNAGGDQHFVDYEAAEKVRRQDMLDAMQNAVKDPAGGLIGAGRAAYKM